MNDLIERLEKATGPDRELDRAICPMAVIEHPGMHGCFLAVVEGKKYGPQHIDVPQYTASIDAAMTLVPKDMSLELQIYREGHPRRAMVTYWGATPNRASRSETHPTSPAIALCIAALKARMALHASAERT